MKKLFIILITMLLAVSCSEKNDTTKGYYDTGELKWEGIPDKSNDKRVISTHYFKNGNVKIRVSTLFINGSFSVLDGPYEEYYSDGSLKWKGKYIEGRAEFMDIDSNVISTIRENSYIKFYDKTELLVPDDTISLLANRAYACRINLNNIYPGRYMVFTRYNDIGDNDGYTEITNNTDTDAHDYPHIIETPDQECELEIACIFFENNGKLIVRKSPRITFKVKVLKKWDTTQNEIP